MHHVIPTEERQFARTRRLLAALMLTLLPLFGLSAFSVYHIRSTAVNIEAAQCKTLQRHAQLAARELAYQFVLAESVILQRIELDSPEALASSLAAAEAATPGCVCFAVLENGVFLYPPLAERLADDPALGSLPTMEPLRTLKAVADQAATLPSRLGANDLARICLPHHERPLLVSLHRLRSGDSSGAIGICWNRQQIEEWCEEVRTLILPDSHRIEIRDPAGVIVAASRTPDQQPSPGTISVSAPLPDGAFPLTLRLIPRDPARMDTLVRRQIAIHGAILAILLLLALAGIGFLVAVTAHDAELARMKAGFAAGVSHELRTPLALIRAAGEALSLRRDMDESRREHYLGIIRRESQRLTDLVNTVQIFTRMARPTHAIAAQANDVTGIARDFVADYRPHAEELGFTFRAEIPDGPRLVKVDPEALRIVLVNLLDNAIKFSPDRKEIALEIGARDCGVTIRMSDRGIGIAPQERSRIFIGYVRGSSEQVRRTRGTGLGLALVRRIVRAHHGRISVESEEGRGTVFEIWLPACGE